MSDILADIDDTLANWNGSADSMRWRPEAPADEDVAGPAWTLTDTHGRTFTVRDVAIQTPSPLRDPAQDDRDERLYLEPFTLTMEFPLAEPAPEQGYWEAAALRRHICGMFEIRPRELGFPPRYGFDARYRQRQKNRHKRHR